MQRSGSSDDLITMLAGSEPFHAEPPFVGPNNDLDLVLHLTVHRIWEIDQKAQTYKMHYTWDIFFRDCRLLHNCSTLTIVDSNPYFAGYYFPNLKMNEMEDDLEEMRSFRLSFFDDGSAVSTQTRVGTFRCKFDFHEMPFDVQDCFLVITSQVDLTSHVRLRWLPDNKVLVEDTSDAEWDITNEWVVTERNVSQYFAIGTFEMSGIIISFSITRNPNHVLMQNVFSSSLFWSISWIGLFIDKKAAPARVTLGVVPVLIQITQLNTLALSLPAISYESSLHYFLHTCLALLVFHMFEYGVLSYCMLQIKFIDSCDVNPASWKSEQEYKVLIFLDRNLDCITMYLSLVAFIMNLIKFFDGSPG